jgi:hypothetical protein
MDLILLSLESSYHFYSKLGFIECDEEEYKAFRFLKCEECECDDFEFSLSEAFGLSQCYECGCEFDDNSKMMIKTIYPATN